MEGFLLNLLFLNTYCVHILFYVYSGMYDILCWTHRFKIGSSKGQDRFHCCLQFICQEIDHGHPSDKNLISPSSNRRGVWIFQWVWHECIEPVFDSLVQYAANVYMHICNYSLFRHWIELNWIELNWLIELNWIELNWIELYTRRSQ